MKWFVCVRMVCMCGMVWMCEDGLYVWEWFGCVKWFVCVGMVWMCEDGLYV